MPSIRCPKCEAALRVSDEAIGKKVRCKYCETVFPVLEPVGIAVPPPLPAADAAKKAATQVVSAAGGALKAMGQLIPQPKPAEVVVAQPSKLSPLLSKLTAEEQDPDKTAAIIERVGQILTAAEELSFVAIQEKPVANWFPDAVVLTNRRFIIYRPKMLGRVDFEDYLWRDLHDVRLKEDFIGATLSFTVAGKKLGLDYLPKKQARQLYRIAQHQEELALEERRQRHMEEQRAAAGGFVIQNAVGMPAGAAPAPVPAATPDPLAKLGQLKQMLDAGLITPDEYDQKKMQILAAM